jgi:hypothetical protein
MSTTQRHFGTIRGGEEVVIAGHNKSTNACFVIRITHLPQDEGADLRRIAMSTSAQNLDYLIPTLRVELHKSNQDWFTHLASRLHRNDGSVVSLPLKEIETMNEQQKAFFKGYGSALEPNGGPSSRVGGKQEFSTPVATEEGDVVVAQPMTEDRVPANLEQARAQGVIAPTPQNDPEMARAAAQANGGGTDNAALLSALSSLAESNAKTAEAMATMAEKMRPAARKTTTRRKAPAKKAASA